ncbi:MAG: NAD(P)/FAD-dependent oxidoreductase [Jiangellaceae bacterium]
MTYDVIIVGTRVAGAPTAMLLARAGLRVLAVDRARFPSDTMSTHQIQVPGVSRLHRWGLLGRVIAAGTPATPHVRLDVGGVAVEGSFPAVGAVSSLFSPRRTLLDGILVDAAKEAGAEVREGFQVDELVWEHGRVVGVRGRSRRGAAVVERAQLIVGADGKNSLVARDVAARTLRQQPPTTLAAYTYWSGVPLDAGEVYHRPGRAVAAFPTNDGLTMVYVAAPAADLPRFRADMEGEYLRSLDRCSDLGDRVRAGERAERIRATPALPNAVRVPFGPGWALVGDAGLVLDPVSAQGISQAFRDADLLAAAVVTTRDLGRPLDAGLATYQRARDAAALPMYDLTLELAKLEPSVRTQLLLDWLAGRPDEITRFLGVFAGVQTPARYSSLRNMLRVLGPRGLVRFMAGRQPRRSTQDGLYGPLERTSDVADRHVPTTIDQ